MPAQWTGDMVGKMHNNRITMTQVAEKLGVTKAYADNILEGGALEGYMGVGGNSQQ